MLKSQSCCHIKCSWSALFSHNIKHQSTLCTARPHRLVYTSLQFTITRLKTPEESDSMQNGLCYNNKAEQPRGWRQCWRYWRYPQGKVAEHAALFYSTCEWRDHLGCCMLQYQRRTHSIISPCSADETGWHHQNSPINESLSVHMTSCWLIDCIYIVLFKYPKCFTVRV